MQIAQIQRIGDLERARRDGRRAFYDSISGTIRSCPEDFCLVVVRGERRTALLDRAVPGTWQAAVLRAVEESPAGEQPEGIAERVALAIENLTFNQP